MATYSKIGFTTGNNVRIRKTASTSGASVTQVPNSGTMVLTNGVTSSGSGYTWYYLSAEVDHQWHTGYMVTDYVDVLNESISISTNGYSSGKTLTLSWTSAYANYVNVSYVLSDSLGNTFYPSGNSCTINLSNYYSDGQSVTFTLTASYSYDTGTTSVVFSKSDESRSIGVTYVGPTVSTPNRPNVEYNYNTKKFSVSWNSCVGSYGSGDVTYTVYYGEWEDGYQAYSKYVSTSTSTTIDLWYPIAGKSIVFYFSVVAHYSNISSSSSDYGEYTVYGPYISWEDSLPTPTVSQSGTSLMISWTRATVVNDTGNVYYIVRCTSNSGIDDAVETTDTSASMQIPAYGVELNIIVTAICDSPSLSIGSKTAQFIAEEIVVEPSYYTIRTYINGMWQDSIVRYYDGISWIECVPQYYNGTQWVECSF